MMLGSLLDVGAPAEVLLSLPDRLGLANEVRIGVQSVQTRGIRAIDVQVETLRTGPSRGISDILFRIEQAGLPERARIWATLAFRRLARVEGRIHNVSEEEVHFHEVGAHDALIDIVGTCCLVDALDPTRVLISPINLGGGMTRGAHGELPIPAPATLALLDGYHVYGSSVKKELTTPTGAALAATLAEPTLTLPLVTVQRAGYGAGHYECPWPNVLRVLLLEPVPQHHWVRETASIVETNIDDMSPQLFGALLERLMTEGARDVWLTPVHMKKGRPAVTVSVMCAPEHTERLASELFRESTTLGVRVLPLQAWHLPREMVTVQTRFGAAHIKVAYFEGQIRSWSAEYEDCRTLARQQGVPVRRVMEEVWAAGREWATQQGGITP